SYALISTTKTHSYALNLPRLASLSFREPPSFTLAATDAILARHQDKIAHFAVSEVLTSGGLKLSQIFSPKRKLTLWHRLGVSAVVLGIGIAKEARDAQKPGGRFDGEDLIADMLGIVTGNLLQWQF